MCACSSHLHALSTTDPTFRPPPQLERRALRGGLEALVGHLKKPGCIESYLKLVPEAEERLWPQPVSSLLHAAHEATSNVIRHAEVSVVKAKPFQMAGQGLRNMAERAKMIGACLAVVSSPSDGTEFCLDVPTQGVSQL